MLVETKEPGWIPLGARVLVLEGKELAWIPLVAKELLVGTKEPGWIPLWAKVLVLERSLLGTDWVPRNCWWKQRNLAGSHWGPRHQCRKRACLEPIGRQGFVGGNNGTWLDPIGG